MPEAFLVCRNFKATSLPAKFELNSMSPSPVLSLDCFGPTEENNDGESDLREWNKIKRYTIGDLSGWEE